jgi:hypothetical protein
MVLDSLGSIGTLSLQRQSVLIASDVDRKRYGTSVVALNLILRRAKNTHVSPCEVYLADAFEFPSEV